MIKLGLSTPRTRSCWRQTREHEMGLDRPYIVQLGDYVWKLCHGDLGDSYVYSSTVCGAASSGRIPNTLMLGIGAMI